MVSLGSKFQALAVALSFSLATSATVYLPAPQTPFETAVRKWTDPIIDWNAQLFGITAEGVYDDWHDANGEPKGTPAKVQAFVNKGVALWRAAGPALAALASQANSTDANYDYLSLIKAVYPDGIYTTWFYRLAAPWSSGLGISLAAAEALGNQYGAAWLGAIQAVETTIPPFTRDYTVTAPLFYLPDDLRRYYYPSVAAHIEAIPWKPIIQYCGTNKQVCSNTLKNYNPNKCYSTSNLGVPTTSVAITNTRLGFPWTCQIYTDAACTTPVFIPAQPCTLPPPIDVYCPKTQDWHGAIGISNGLTTSSENNPSGLSAINAGSFKCT